MPNQHKYFSVCVCSFSFSSGRILHVLFSSPFFFVGTMQMVLLFFFSFFLFGWIVWHLFKAYFVYFFSFSHFIFVFSKIWRLFNYLNGPLFFFSLFFCLFVCCGLYYVLLLIAYLPNCICNEVANYAFSLDLTIIWLLKENK